MKQESLLSSLLILSLLFCCTAFLVSAQEESEKTDKPRFDNIMSLFSSGIFRSGPANVHWLPDESGYLYEAGGVWHMRTLPENEETKLFSAADLARLLPERETAGEDEDNTNATGRFNRSAMAFSADGSFMVGLHDNDLYRYSIADNSAVWLTEGGGVEEFQAISPDGRWVAYTKDHDLWVVSTQGGEERRLTDNGDNEELWNGIADWVYEEELGVRRVFWWSPDSTHIAYLQFDTSPVREFLIIDHLNRWPNPERQKFAMAGTDNSIVRLGILSLASGETTWVDSTAGDDSYIYDADWNADGSGLLYRKLNRTQTRLELILATPGGETRVLTTEERETWVNARAQWLGPGFEVAALPGGGFILLSERDGFFHLYRLSEDGAIEQLTWGDWMVDNIQAWSNSHAWVIARAGHPLELNAYRVALDGSGMVRLTNLPGNNNALVSPAGSYMIVTNSAIDRQRRITVEAADGTVIEELLSRDNPRLQNFDFNHTQLVELKAEDGTPLFGALTLPPGYEEGKSYPVIIYTYGGPGVQLIMNAWSPQIAIMHQLLAGKGYVVWTLDNRGSWGRGHNFEKGLKGQTGELELVDQMTGLQWLIDQGIADPQRVGITGSSYGGYLTLMALLKQPDMFHVGVAQSPGVDWGHYDTLYTERYMGLPADNEEGYKKSDAAYYARGLKGKLLITHGMMDNNVHVQQVFQMIDALIKAGKDFEIMLYPEERHGIGTPARMMHSFNGLLRFFDEHL